jgi:Fur family ferric uptake transcriptional regulator
MPRKIDIEALCAEKGLRITEQRRVIARVLSEAEDHPDVERVHERSAAIDPGISIATVYRTVRLFEEAGILERHDFGDGRSRYEAAPEAHHDHLVDVETGNVIEFVDPELEQLQKQIAEKLGFRLVDHRQKLRQLRRVSDNLHRPFLVRRGICIVVPMNRCQMNVYDGERMAEMLGRRD